MSNNLTSTFLGFVPTHGRIDVRQPSAQLSAVVGALAAVAMKTGYKKAMGNSGQVPGEVATLEQLGIPRGQRIETICEIGFNAGHSAAALLMHNNATLHEFDVMTLKWSRACLDEVERRYPGRVVLHKGDSKFTGRAFAEKVQRGQARPCDIFFIDGLHSNPQVYWDFHTAVNATRPGGLIMADDTTALFKTVLKMWQMHTARGDLVEPRCAYPVRNNKIGLRSFCVAERAPSPAHRVPKDWPRQLTTNGVSWKDYITTFDWKAAWKFHVQMIKNATRVY